MTPDCIWNWCKMAALRRNLLKVSDYAEICRYNQIFADHFRTAFHWNWWLIPWQKKKKPLIGQVNYMISLRVIHVHHILSQQSGWSAAISVPLPTRSHQSLPSFPCNPLSVSTHSLGHQSILAEREREWERKHSQGNSMLKGGILRKVKWLWMVSLAMPLLYINCWRLYVSAWK